MASAPVAQHVERGSGTAGLDSDGAACEELYQRHARRLLSYCLYQLGGVREEAEDAVQVTFLHALRALRRGVVPHAEAAWLFGIARNVCSSRWQAEHRRRRFEVLFDPQKWEHALASPPDGAEELGRLRAALDELPAAQRRAMLLREWQGLAYREIAAELELSEAAVETLIFRARRSLVEKLTDAPVKRRRRLAVVLDLGSLVEGLKAAFAGGSLVKASLAVAVLGGTVVAGGSFADAPPESGSAGAHAASAAYPAPVLGAGSAASRAPTHSTAARGGLSDREQAPAGPHDQPLPGGPAPPAADGRGAHDPFPAAPPSPQASEAPSFGPAPPPGVTVESPSEAVSARPGPAREPAGVPGAVASHGTPTAVGRLLDAAGGLLPEVPTLVSSSLQGLADAARELLPGVTNVVSSALPELTAVAGEVLPGVTNVVSSPLPEVAAAADDVLPQVARVASTATRELLPKVARLEPAPLAEQGVEAGAPPRTAGVRTPSPGGQAGADPPPKAGREAPASPAGRVGAPREGRPHREAELPSSPQQRPFPTPDPTLLAPEPSTAAPPPAEPATAPQAAPTAAPPEPAPGLPLEPADPGGPALPLPETPVPAVVSGVVDTLLG